MAKVNICFARVTPSNVEGPPKNVGIIGPKKIADSPEKNAESPEKNAESPEKESGNMQKVKCTSQKCDFPK